MNKIRGIRYAIVGAFLAACGASGAALAVDEVEPNFPITVAQPLTFEVNGSATVNGYMDAGDTDIYSFQATAGDVVTFDIDGGIKIGAGSVDTYLTVLGPAPVYLVLSKMDDSPLGLDPGSISDWDSYIDKLTIMTTGTHYVAVTGAQNALADGGVFINGGNSQTGSYTLIVTGVSPIPVAPAPAPDPVADPVPAPAPEPVAEPVPAPDSFPVVALPIQQISIDIKPGLRRMARIDTKSREEIPVALMSSSTFNALSVDVDSLTFGRTGDEQSLKKCHKHGVDVNRDGRRDLVCHFQNQLAGFDPSDESGIVKGTTANGPFEGRGMLKVVSEKRKSRWSHGGNRDDDRDDDRRDKNKRNKDKKR